MSIQRPCERGHLAGADPYIFFSETCIACISRNGYSIFLAYFLRSETVGRNPALVCSPLPSPLRSSTQRRSSLGDAGRKEPSRDPPACLRKAARALPTHSGLGERTAPRGGGKKTHFVLVYILVHRQFSRCVERPHKTRCAGAPAAFGEQGVREASPRRCWRRVWSWLVLGHLPSGSAAAGGCCTLDCKDFEALQAIIGFTEGMQLGALAICPAIRNAGSATILEAFIFRCFMRELADAKQKVSDA